MEVYTKHNIYQSVTIKSYVFARLSTMSSIHHLVSSTG